MIEYIALALIAYICYQDYSNRRERKRLLDAFLAKNLEEFKELESPSKPLTIPEEKLPDAIPLDEASDEEFDTAIKKELGTETFVEKAVDKLKKVVKRG